MRNLTWLGLFLAGLMLVPACGDDEDDKDDDDTTTTTGTGGAGGGTPTGVNGAACSADTDCDGGVCLSETTYGWPSGLCSAECEMPGEACPDGGVCTSYGLCLAPCATAADCRDGYTCLDPLGEGNYCWPQCTTDAQCPEVGTCQTGPGLCVAHESECNDLIDNDEDSFIDCEDPMNCQGTPACTPGTTATGEACDAHNDCTATGGDPLCVDEVSTGWPMGSCSEFCDLNASGSCSAGAVCVDAGFDSGNGICMHSCTTAADCRAGYTCSDNAGPLTCLPLCTDDAQCTDFCNLDDGLCTPTDEDCANGEDDDGDGMNDCEGDLDCSATCAPQIEAACLTAAPTLMTNAGDTTNGTNTFAGSCTGAGAREVIYTYTPTGPGTLTLTLMSATDQGVYVRSACADMSAQIECEDTSLGGTNEVLSVPVELGQPLTIFVDGYLPGEEGPFTLSLAFAASVCGDGTVAGPEECDDGNTTPGDGCDANCKTE